MKNSVIIYLNLSLFTITLLSCNHEANQERSSSNTKQPSLSIISNDTALKITDKLVLSQFDEIIKHYLRIKDGFVATNGIEARIGAEGILNTLAHIDSLKFTNAQLNFFKNEVEVIKENALQIKNNTDILKQRSYFNQLSQSTFFLFKNLGCEKKLYYDFCPMANDNKGGYWISENEEIKNPYFGDEMLNCGEIKGNIN